MISLFQYIKGINSKCLKTKQTFCPELVLKTAQKTLCLPMYDLRGGGGKRKMEVQVGHG